MLFDRLMIAMGRKLPLAAYARKGCNADAGNDLHSDWHLGECGGKQDTSPIVMRCVDIFCGRERPASATRLVAVANERLSPRDAC